MNRALLYTSFAFVAAVILHGIDHVLQERGVGALTTEVMVGGTINALAAFAMLGLVLAGYRRAPLVAAAVGFYVAAGVTAAHLLPHWSAFSDPYSELSLGAFSWAAALAEIVAGVALGLAGLRALRRDRLEPAYR